MIQRTSVFILLAAVSFVMLSCGSDSSSPEFAGITFTLKWPDTSARMTGSILKAAPAGVATIRMSISAPDMATMTKDFPAAAGSGSITNVPSGTNRTITFQGLVANGCVLYQGSEAGITLSAGQTYHCNDIVMVAVVNGCGSVPSAPVGIVATPASGQVTISWSAVTGAISYNIYWSTTAGVTKATGTRIVDASNPYVHAMLTNGVTYYYVVTGVNSVGESADSLQANAIPIPDTLPPPSPFYKMDVLEGGAAASSSANYHVTAAVKGQSEGIGFSSSANYTNHAGFSITTTGALMP